MIYQPIFLLMLFNSPGLRWSSVNAIPYGDREELCFYAKRNKDRIPVKIGRDGDGRVSIMPVDCSKSMLDDETDAAILRKQGGS